MNALQRLQQWVQDYKDDDPPIRVGQEGAIKALDYFLEVFGRHGDMDITMLLAAQDEVRRCQEIISAFNGKLSILAFMKGYKAPDEDD